MRTQGHIRALRMFRCVPCQTWFSAKPGLLTFTSLMADGRKQLGKISNLSSVMENRQAASTKIMNINQQC